jgi:A/G-specific adenine glycosylase
VGVIWKEEKVLIALRPENGLLGGLWEFPGGKCRAGESLPACVQREIEEETGLAVQVGNKITTIRHAYTHFKITMHAFHCSYKGGEAVPHASQSLQWVPFSQLDQYAFPKANKRVIESLCAAGP